MPDETTQSVTDAELSKAVSEAFNTINELMTAAVGEPWMQVAVVAACLAHADVYDQNLDKLSKHASDIRLVRDALAKSVVNHLFATGKVMTVDLKTQGLA